MNKLLNGNEAFAYGCLMAKIDAFFGYPITPSTDVYEMLEKLLPKWGKTFVAAWSEISAVNMLMGAGASGKRALTATSGCGFSLMQETISYMAADFVPAVILNVMREGAGLGDIPRSQGDYNQMTKGGGNGDYHSIVLSCQNINDCFSAPTLAFQLAEKYRNPVIITYDSDIAHTKESIDINEDELIENAKTSVHSKENWCLTGNTRNAPNIIQNVYYHNADYDNLLRSKYEQIEEECQDFEEYHLDDAEVVLVAYGIEARICKEAMLIGREKNLKIGLIVLRTLYPFPKKAFEKIKVAKKIVVVELNIFAQMKCDVEYYTKFKYKVVSINKMSVCPTINEILEECKNV